VELAVVNGTAALTLEGVLDDSAELAFNLELDKVVAARPRRFVLRMEDLQAISSMCARALAFSAKRLDIETEVFIVGTPDRVKDTLQHVGFLEEAIVLGDISEVEGA
jgi:anti-anti-sigma factor